MHCCLLSMFLPRRVNWCAWWIFLAALQVSCIILQRIATVCAPAKDDDLIRDEDYVSPPSLTARSQPQPQP
jgi:hypothetical protein